MSRKLTYLAFALGATACTADVTEPKAAAPGPDASALLFYSVWGYQASALPLDYGAAINGAGNVVGTLGGQGAYYAQGVTTTLPLLSSVAYVTPVDLLDDGRILARGNGTQGPKALYYFNATTAPIDIAAPYWAEPHAMNNQGVAVGRFGAPGRSWGAFRWTAATGAVDITPAGYELGWATDVSATGYAIGWVQLGNTVYNYLWNPASSAGVVVPSVTTYQALNGGVLVRHPTIGSATWSTYYGYTAAGPDPVGHRVTKISSNGRYVGSFTDPTTDQSRAWTSIGTSAATTLPLPAGFVSARAIDVNGCGTILGSGVQAADNKTKAIVWSRSLTCDLAPAVAAW